MQSIISSCSYFLCAKNRPARIFWFQNTLFPQSYTIFKSSRLRIFRISLFLLFSLVRYYCSVVVFLFWSVFFSVPFIIDFLLGCRVESRLSTRLWMLVRLARVFVKNFVNTLSFFRSCTLLRTRMLFQSWPVFDGFCSSSPFKLTLLVTVLPDTAPWQSDFFENRLELVSTVTAGDGINNFIIQVEYYNSHWYSRSFPRIFFTEVFEVCFESFQNLFWEIFPQRCSSELCAFAERAIVSHLRAIFNYFYSYQLRRKFSLLNLPHNQ